MIYLDYNATTPLDPRVLEAMLPFFRDRFGNAASRHHRLAGGGRGRRRRAGAGRGPDRRRPEEIVWTSGATESDNLALQGVAASPAYETEAASGHGRDEHRAVLDCCEHLESHGLPVTYLGVDREGCST